MNDYFKLTEIKSRTEAVKGIDSFYQLEEMLANYGLVQAFAIFYFTHKTAWAKVVNSKFIFKKDTVEDNDFRYINECRIFNENGELLLRRKNGALEGRVRIDAQGDSMEAVDVRQLILGHPQEEQEGFYLLVEEQGQSGWVPFDGELTRTNHLAVLTRNYIGYSGLNAGYVDSRLVAIVSTNKKEEGEA